MGEVIVGEVLTQLVVALVVEPFDNGILMVGRPTMPCADCGASSQT